MKNSFVLLLCALLFCATNSYAAADKTLLSAREAILSSSVSPQDALLKYSEAVKKTNAAPVLGEYAYALACAGLGEAALTSIDRALIAEPLHPEIRFYLSEIFNAAGLEAASDDISAPAPAWLKGRQVKLPNLDVIAPAADFETAAASLNMLMSQRRYAQATVQYDRLCKDNQAEPRCHVGYALALERLGAYKAAAAEASTNLALYKDPEPQAEQVNNFTAGAANSLSFGLSGALMDVAGNSGAIDKNSAGYKLGENLTLALSLGRLSYAGLTKIGTKIAKNGLEANATRNLLKKIFRLGPWGSDYLTYEKALLLKGTDTGVKAAAGRTNLAFNLWSLGAGLTSLDTDRCDNDN